MSTHTRKPANVKRLEKLGSAHRLAPGWREAIERLTQLPEDGCRRAASVAIAYAIEDELREDGWQRVQSTCLAKLIDGRCQLCHSDRLGLPHEPPCSDHEQMFRLPDGSLVYVCHPYDLSGEDLAEIHAFCNKHNLQVRLDGNSSHFAGKTLRMVFTAKKA